MIKPFLLHFGDGWKVWDMASQAGLNDQEFYELVNNFNFWRPPKVNATAYSQTGCSGWAPAPELSPFGAPAAATSPYRSVCE